MKENVFRKDMSLKCVLGVNCVIFYNHSQRDKLHGSIKKSLVTNEGCEGYFFTLRKSSFMLFVC